MNADEAKRRSRGESTDMSPEAIGQRIAIAGELHDLWQWLRRAERIGPVERADALAEPRPEPWPKKLTREDSGL